MDGNQFVEVPGDSLRYLFNLKELNLSSNLLTQLTDSSFDEETVSFRYHFMQKGNSLRMMVYFKFLTFLILLIIRSSFDNYLVNFRFAVWFELLFHLDV